MKYESDSALVKELCCQCHLGADEGKREREREREREFVMLLSFSSLVPCPVFL